MTEVQIKVAGFLLFSSFVLAASFLSASIYVELTTSIFVILANVGKQLYSCVGGTCKA